MNKFNYPDAFMLVEYSCEKCSSSIMIWNSRNGVTPFSIGCLKCNSVMSHINQKKDKFIPYHVLKNGENYFASQTYDEYKDMMMNRISKDEDNIKKSNKEIEMIYESLNLQFNFEEGHPILKEYKEALYPKEEILKEIIKDFKHINYSHGIQTELPYIDNTGRAKFLNMNTLLFVSCVKYIREQGVILLQIDKTSLNMKDTEERWIQIMQDKKNIYQIFNYKDYKTPIIEAVNLIYRIKELNHGL